ncbi:hypothetical protein [Nannocystis pusilla]|uniref:hypothetical protein n=1 Tax=Nannocystis pusilla TaxID=889268 RepID=UPI003B7C6EB2
MEALLSGTLIEQSGCLRVSPDGKQPGHLLIWQPGYGVRRTGDRLEIVDSTGKVVARVGEPLRTGGGQVQLTDALRKQLKAPLDAACVGPYWLMGQLQTPERARETAAPKSRRLRRCESHDERAPSGRSRATVLPRRRCKSGASQAYGRRCAPPSSPCCSSRAAPTPPSRPRPRALHRPPPPNATPNALHRRSRRTRSSPIACAWSPRRSITS